MKQEQEVVQFVDRYLQMYEDLDLVAVKKFWDKNSIRMTFPGGKEFLTFEELAEWSKSRYQWVRKNREKYIISLGETISAVCIGTLYGENNYGKYFEGIRFIDVLKIRNGLIVEQLVWNDIAESGVLLDGKASNLPEGECFRDLN